MSLPWWKPDEELLSASLAEIERCASGVRRALSHTPHAFSGPPADQGEESAKTQMGDLLNAVGTVAFLGFGDTARDRLGDLAGSPDACDLATAALQDLIENNLTRVLGGLMDDIYHLASVEDEDKEFLEERIVDALDERDRVELALEGARLLCGREPDLDEEALAALGAFDDVLRADLWRTLPLGDRRAARCAWAAPEYRERLWWWHRGCDLPHTALQDMQTAARVIHLFPEAREELERMLQAEQDFENLCAASEGRGRVKVISLREYLLRKFRPVSAPATDERHVLAAVEFCAPYGLVAAGYEEKTLYQTAELTVSTDGESLIVDIESPAEPAPDSSPVLEAPGYAPLAATKAPEPARFEFSLSSAPFSAPEAWLLVRLTNVERRIRLPFDEND